MTPRSPIDDMVLEAMIEENRRMRPDLWQQSMTYWEMMYGLYSFKSFQRKEKIRRSWYYRNGHWGVYREKVWAGPIPLKFSLWEQAEARHKNDKPGPKIQDELQDRKDRRAVRDIYWGITNGAAFQDPWVPNTSFT